MHLASEAGRINCIIFLIKEAGVDHSIKNRFGYVALDIASDMDTKTCIERMIGAEGSGRHSTRLATESSNYYGRTAFNGVLRHNDRVTHLKALMHKFGQVERHLQVNN